MSLRKNKTVKIFIIVITLFLLGIWWISSLAFNSYTGFSSIKYQFKLNEEENKYLYKNEKIKGEFISNDNNLGIVGVHFSRYVKPDFEFEDEIIFRLKEKGKNSWLYEQKYHSGLMEGIEVYPFGFPVIENSKNKVYLFEVQSLKGDMRNALSLTSKPEFFTEYVFPKQSIKNEFPNYLIKKSINSIFNYYYLLSSAIFMLPLVLFFLILSFFYKNKYLEKYLPGVTLFLMLIDIFFLSSSTTGVSLVLLGTWLICLRLGRIGSSINFLLAGVLILIWMISAYFMNDTFTNKLNIWTYSFLAVGVFELLLEQKFKIANLKNVDSLINKVKKYG